MENNVYSREKIKLIITEDLMFRSPIWAMALLIIWGAISFFTIWIMLNVIVPSYEKGMKMKKSDKVIGYYEKSDRRQYN